MQTNINKKAVTVVANSSAIAKFKWGYRVLEKYAHI